MSNVSTFINSQAILEMFSNLLSLMTEYIEFCIYKPFGWLQMTVLINDQHFCSCTHDTNEHPKTVERWNGKTLNWNTLFTKNLNQRYFGELLSIVTKNMIFTKLGWHIIWMHSNLSLWSLVPASLGYQKESEIKS